MLTEQQEIALHRIKNKLAGIRAYARVAIEEREARQRTRIEGPDFLREIETLACDMAVLLQEMLETRVARHSLTLHKEHSDVTALACRVVASNRSQAAIKNIALHVTTQTPCYAEIDGNRLGEALDNLVSNAIKYSPPSTSVWISVQRDRSEGVCLDVRDEGVGFAECDRNGLPAKAPRRAAQPPGSEASTGLGLAIAQRIAEDHGGRLSAESDGPNQGSVFRIWIPVSVHPVDHENV